MKIEYNKLDNEKAKFNSTYEVIVFSDEITKKIDSNLVKFQKNFSMPGFRPGNVPLQIIRQKKMNEVLGETLEEALQESSFRLYTLEKVKPSSQPKIEIKQYELGKDLQYKISFDFLPQMPEVDFTEITLDSYIPEISDEEVNDAIEKISQDYKSYSPVERKSKNGDEVVIDFKGFVDDEAFKGGEAKGYHLVLGSKSFVDNFEQQLIGKEIGEEIEVNVTFPENYQGNLSGKKAKFEVVITAINEPETQEINDALAEKLGYENLDTLKEDIKKRIGFEYEVALRNITKKELFDKLHEKIDAEVPEKIVQQESEAILNQVKSAEKKDDFKITKNFEKKVEDIAKRRVVLGLFLSQTGERNALEVTNSDIEGFIRIQAQQFPEEAHRLVDYYQKNPQVLESLRGPMLEEKVVDFILKRVKTNEMTKTSKEIKEIIEQKSKEADKELGISDY